MFKWPFPPPSPARPIMSVIRKRRKTKKGKPASTGAIPEDDGKKGETPMDKNFGFPRNFLSKYEVGKEVCFCQNYF
ncbi:hypothetical protein L1987_34533 [Smallanthus sonchifolius]|uniref:Uncharacterized protein n=1 Tax=Smallanthus sonchifolius TaxID=185202 RepID=A0ACB9HVK9_9ASTR|nr:hypothetical protein L1987_34533 [Smallanthus sonchifolius]